MPSLLGCQCWFSSDASRTPFLGAKPMVTCCAHAGLVFSFSVFFGGGILGESLPDLFHVHCSDKTQNCAENHASWEQFLRVIWKVVFQAVVLSLAQIKFFSYCWLFLLTDVFVWLCFLTNIISLFFYFFSALLKSQRWMPSTEKV